MLPCDRSTCINAHRARLVPLRKVGSADAKMAEDMPRPDDQCSVGVWPKGRLSSDAHCVGTSLQRRKCETARQNNRFLPERQMVCMIYVHFEICDSDETLLKLKPTTRLVKQELSPCQNSWRVRMWHQKLLFYIKKNSCIQADVTESWRRAFHKKGVRKSSRKNPDLI